MTVLSGEILRTKLFHEDLNKRLVIKPILELNEQLRESQASIDVRLGSDFALIAPSSYGQIDELDIIETSDNLALPNLYRKVYVPLGSEIILHPHQFILAITLEYFRLPMDLMAYVVGRSTWGRLGLIVATAIGVHPGFAGCLTLELRNLGETPLSLRPGQTIAQLFFHEVRRYREAEVEGQYRGATDILPGKLSSCKTVDKLHKLRRLRGEKE